MSRIENISMLLEHVLFQMVLPQRLLLGATKGAASDRTVEWMIRDMPVTGMPFDGSIVIVLNEGGREVLTATIRTVDIRITLVGGTSASGLDISGV